MENAPAIRPGRPADAEAAADIAVAAWKPVYRWRRELLGEEIFRAEWPKGAEVKRDEILRAFTRHPRYTIVTELAGRVVGFATWWEEPGKGFAEIGNNAVHPDFQGRGIGTMQCRHLLDLFRRRGVKFARVRTGLDPAHAPARRQYEKAGFALKVPAVTYYMKLE